MEYPPVLDKKLSSYRVESKDLNDFKELGEIWKTLQLYSDCSFFQSWSWIGVWLSQIVSKLSPNVVIVYLGSEVVGLGIFIPEIVKRHQFIYSRTLFLNELPLGSNNMVIEYNGILAAKGHESEVYAHTIQYLLNHHPGADEFYFGALSSVTNLEEAISHCTENVEFIYQKESIAWSVCLKDIGDGINGYLSTLSKNRRLQIKRSLRLYEESGSLNIHEADSVECANAYFGGLKELHTLLWKNRGATGSFANSRWENFHRTLISNGFKRGEIQLLKVSNAHKVIGYLYNFVWRGRVYVLQTGFTMEKDKRFMPGYVSHVLAIEYNKRIGLEVYDLMHGDNLYKQLLCNQQQLLYWVILQRKRFKFAIEDLARIFKRKFIS